MSDGRMRRFWDRRAEEDAFFFVDSRLRYRDPDVEAFWREGREALEFFLDSLGSSVAGLDAVLDLGCGVGRLSRALAAQAGRVVAVDVSPAMLDRARELNAHLDNVDWVIGDGRTLAGVPDRSVDACVSLVVFQHLPSPELTLGYVREMGRVLRRGGFAAFQVSNDPGVHRRRAGLRHRARALAGRAPSGQTEPEWLGSAVEIDELAAACEEGGMEVERVAGEGTQYCSVLARRLSA